MPAIRAHQRGGPDRLRYEPAPIPVPGPADVLVEVEAAGVTRAELDWDLTWETRDGVDRTPIIPAHEFVGRVAGGAIPDDMMAGDRVIGLVDFDRNGAAARWTVVDRGAVAPAPVVDRALDLGGLPLGALTAWQALTEVVDVGTGDRVAVLGAAGAVGVLMVQIARHLGATVTAAVRGHDHDALLRSLGADRIVDLSTSRLGDQSADVIVDTVGGFRAHRHLPGGAPRR
jgi:NADPH:quinone reductase-like Zn-dependent oxidoreductase